MDLSPRERCRARRTRDRKRKTTRGSLTSISHSKEFRRKRRAKRSSKCRRERAAKKSRESGKRSHRETGRGSSADVDLNPAEKGFGKSIAALRAEMKAMRGHMLDRPFQIRCEVGPSNPAQTRLKRPTKAEGGTSMSTPEPVPSSIELAKTARATHDKVICNRPLLLRQVCSWGEQSGLNDPMLFNDHIERYFAYADVGVTCRHMYPPKAQNGRLVMIDSRACAATC